MDQFLLEIASLNCIQRQQAKSFERMVVAMQRTMGKTYQENLTNQQRLEGGAGLQEEIIRAYGEPPAHHWQSVLVSIDSRTRHLAVLTYSLDLADIEAC